MHRNLTGIVALGLCAACAAGCPRQGRGSADATATMPEADAGTLRLTSTAFASRGEIPSLYTCEGSDTSPPLAWSGVPAGTKSLALVVEDPDAPDPAAPRTIWVHWVLYDLPPTSTGVAEGDAALPAGTRQGRNDWDRTGYGGPCPPVGRHRYVHRLLALDTVLPDLGEPTKAQLEEAFAGHVIDRAELVGMYQKSVASDR
jgi:Raf kinase inhibitor-like YbhB/YbcL family protein